ncbi:hypothetical protein BJX70DRAFT_380474 [Aspergillus crustosus]
MDNSLCPSLFVTIPSSSEKVPPNHGSPIVARGQTAPQPATPEQADVGADKKTRRHHRKGKGGSRDGIFRHRMHQVSSRAVGRGPLSTYREQDSEEDGLLRPITRETTRTRWGSDSTGFSAGSRKGSVFDEIDKDIRLISIKRSEEIRSVDDLQRVRDQRNRGEEYEICWALCHCRANMFNNRYLRSALSVIGTLATDITRRLDYTYYGLLEKIAALNVTIASFQELSDSASKLFDDFQRETTGLEQDIWKQIGDLHDFQPQLQRIEALEERMRASKTRAKDLGNRLEAMRNEIERWDKREIEWQTRTNQRLRIFWGLVITAILAILVAIVLQHWPSDEAPPGFRTIPRALKIPSIPSRNPLPKQHDGFSGYIEQEYAWPADPSSLAYIGTPTTTTDRTTLSGSDSATNPADYDPLRILDEI